MTWLFLSFVAPIFWAVVTVLDTYFVHGVYNDEYDATIISGVFQSLPWILVLFGVVEFVQPNTYQLMYAMVAGALFMLSFYFYFKALFIENDAALMQILWSTCVLVVPFIAWFLMGEKLLPMHYLGIGLSFLGVVAFCFNGRISGEDGFVKMLVLMATAVIALSFSMIFSKEAYEGEGGFWGIFLHFSLAATLMSMVLMMFDKVGVRTRIENLTRMSGQYFWIFLLAELFSVIGTVASQSAIRLAPSVSFVATIESLVPVFVMMIGFILMLFFRKLGMTEMALVFQKQYSEKLTKLFAILVIASGIYLIG